MNIAVDIGNTLIKVGVFEGELLIKSFVIGDQAGLLQYLIEEEPENIILSSVRTDFQQLIDRLRSTISTLVLSSDTNIPLKNLYKTPSTLGSDRLAGVVGATTLYPGVNILVIDAGTCITYDFVDYQNQYFGGSISPGIKMRFQALQHFTGKLPQVESSEIDYLVGKSTKESILSGVINGVLFEFEGFINKYQQTYSQVNVVVTGGDALSFKSKTNRNIFVLPDLLLIGLNRILLNNIS